MAKSVPNNDCRNNRGTHFGPSPLPVSKVAVIINCVFFFEGGGGVYFSTYLLNEGWTLLLNESVKDKKQEKNEGNFG